MDDLEAMDKAYRDMNKTAFVLGYTGEVGKELIKELSRRNLFSKIVLIGRRRVELEDVNVEKFEQQVVDFEKLDEYADYFAADVGFSCLGTTRGKSGADGFYRVDHDYVVNTAKIAKEKGCSHFLVVSSQGANKNSWLLYPKTKGQVEEELEGFHFPCLSILRPGLLLCDRKERRPTEACIRTLLKPVAKFFPNAMTTPTTIVAKALVNLPILNSEPKGDCPEAKVYEIKSIFDAATQEK